MSAELFEELFRDFDDKTVLGGFVTKALSIESLNFVLDFNDGAARCAFDLKPEDFSRVLDGEGEVIPRTRWINIWAPELQKEIIRAISTKYKFSPRLVALMCCEPLRPVLMPSSHAHRNRLGQVFDRMVLGKDGKHETMEVVENNSSTPNSAAIHGQDDLEDLYDLDEKRDIKFNMLDVNHYSIINEVWHYSSVDRGQHYLCVGYNSLFDTSTVLKPEDQTEWTSSKPKGRRLWTWLVLTSDGTVIAIHENPYPGHRANLSHEEVVDLGYIRRNLVNVFKQISRADEDKPSPNAVMTIKLRSPTPPQSSLPLRPDISLEKSSLLFYYLFDDWYTTYSLVARKEHQYGIRLERLRSQMFQVASLKHIDELHLCGHQLAILKRIYRSYDMIIGSILDITQGEQHPSIGGEGSLSRWNTGFQEATADKDDMEYGVSLAKSARFRFERLRGRINHFALSEIQDCIDEKESLVMLNFNLIALKESSYVERLTRITILLAKATILFLPVSLMSGYFSAQLGVIYTPTQYWVAFSIIFAVTIVGLMIFGQLSGTQEGATIYRSFTKTYLSWLRNRAGSRRKAK